MVDQMMVESCRVTALGPDIRQLTVHLYSSVDIGLMKKWLQSPAFDRALWDCNLENGV